MTLVLQLITIAICVFAFSMPYRDYRSEASPLWLTIPFMITFAVATIVVVLDIFFPILTG